MRRRGRTLCHDSVDSQWWRMRGCWRMTHRSWQTALVTAYAFYSPPNLSRSRPNAFPQFLSSCPVSFSSPPSPRLLVLLRVSSSSAHSSSSSSSSPPPTSFSCHYFPVWSYCAIRGCFWRRGPRGSRRGALSREPQSTGSNPCARTSWESTAVARWSPQISVGCSLYCSMDVLYVCMCVCIYTYI